MSKYRGPTEIRIERSLLPWVPVVFLAYDKELCGRHFLFCSKIWQELWSTGARSPSTHYILRVRYTHNTGASIIANRKKENLPPLGYCLCLQSTPFSAFSSLFGRQPEIRLRSHVNRQWSFCMFACGGWWYFSYILLHEIQTMFSQLAKQSARVLPADRSSP